MERQIIMMEKALVMKVEYKLEKIDISKAMGREETTAHLRAARMGKPSLQHRWSSTHADLKRGMTCMILHM